MNQRDILKLIARGENETTEFKVEKVDSDDLAKAMAAFSSLGGGTILIGVSDKGDVEGIKAPEKLRKRVLDIGIDMCDPRIFSDIKIAKVERKDVLVVKIPEGFIKPCSARGVPYMRVGDRDIRLRLEEAEKLRQETKLATFEELPIKEAAISELDRAKVKLYVRKRSEIRHRDLSSLGFKEVLQNLGAVTKHRGKLAPTVAGMLFFGKKPNRFLRNAAVDCARFKGTGMTEFIDRATLEGSLPELIDDAELFVRKNTRMAAKVIDFERINIPEYPYAAIREAVANAVAHRDYSFSGAVVRVMIFDDRIEVESPGRLPKGVDIKHLEGRHVPRNETIAQLLYDIGYIEKFGTGIRRMREEMKAHGLQEPLFKEDGEFFKVTFYGPGEKILELVKPQRGANLKEMGLNDRQVEALRLMVNEKQIFTNELYQKMFKVSRRTAVRDLQGLVKSKQIKYEGIGKGTKYKA